MSDDPTRHCTGPLLFLIFISDIVSETSSSIRLFGNGFQMTWRSGSMASFDGTSTSDHGYPVADCNQSTAQQKVPKKFFNFRKANWGNIGNLVLSLQDNLNSLQATWLKLLKITVRASDPALLNCLRSTYPTGCQNANRTFLGGTCVLNDWWGRSNVTKTRWRNQWQFLGYIESSRSNSSMPCHRQDGSISIPSYSKTKTWYPFGAT